MMVAILLLQAFTPEGVTTKGDCTANKGTIATNGWLDSQPRNYWIANREMIGQMPTEMFYHFFKSFSDTAKCTLNVKAEGKNEHHKIEAIFKAFAKSIKMAKKKDLDNQQLPSTKGVL